MKSDKCTLQIEDLDDAGLSRRKFLSISAAAGLAAVGDIGLIANRASAAAVQENGSALVRRIKDPEIRAGVEAAIQKSILPAAVETAYAGHFQITAGGSTYGGDATWPGLDSWQMAGAYLLLGRSRLAQDYFDYVRASQRKDGNVPLAIFPEMKANNTCLRGLKWPEDVFTYTPPKREKLPASSQKTRKWIGLFEHWQNVGDPLSTLGPVCYVLTAAEIFDATQDLRWLRNQLTTIAAAGDYLVNRKSKNGLISGSGFYSEQPPRYAWDGITQCYVIHAF